MANKHIKIKPPPSTLPAQLLDEEEIVSWIAEITSQSKDVVRSRLRDEFNSPGINLCHAFEKANLAPHIWSDGLARFYEQTEAFLYELVIWNMNRLKRRLRHRVSDFLMNSEDRPLDVLLLGDGLGFDSVYLAQFGHNITYFELPGYSYSFARKLFAQYPQDITVLSNPDDIPLEKFDAVICLDVLEHVPDPSQLVKAITGYLKPSGKLITHTPFYMIHPSNPTHLRKNRKFSGSLSLFKEHGLKLIDGRVDWNPIVLQKQHGKTKERFAFNPNLLIVKSGGLYLALGRFSTLPFRWVDSYRRSKNNWFER